MQNLGKTLKKLLLENGYWNWKIKEDKISPELDFTIYDFLNFKFWHIFKEKSQNFSFPHFPLFKIIAQLHLENKFKEQSLRLLTFETFDQSDEKTWADQQKDNDEDKDNDKHI